jgi:hypothetical protein
MTNPKPQSDEPGGRRFSRPAIIGTAILPFGFLLVLFFFPILATSSLVEISTWPDAIRYPMLFLGIIAPIASTALGVTSILQIRKSNGKIYGLPLAVLTTLFYPIIFLSLFLIFIGWTSLGSISGSSLVPLAWLFIIIMIDSIIIRFTWRTVKRY